MRYYIIAGEASGDLHASNLIRGLRAEDPEADIRGWGGAFRYDGKDAGWKRTRGRVCERGPDGRKRNVRFPGTPGGVICAYFGDPGGQ